jgi:nicotinamidase-related amidase
MRAFEDYGWRDILTGDMERIYSAYHRERGVAPRSALIIIHPQRGFRATIQPDWLKAVDQLARRVRALGQTVIHSVPTKSDPYPDIDVRPSDPVCRRPCESAFLFADMEPVLTRSAASGVIVCGAPTSGAVRATAVEAKSFGYRTAIAEETVGDEAALLHKVALFDIAHKYADVMSLDEMQAFMPIKVDL